jgi:hypothetical protein
MAINKNHEFEELNGIKCGIAEKNVSKERADFLKTLLEYNRYTVIIVPSPPPKAPVAEQSPETVTQLPETFTVGVTDYTFNPVNAIFGRLLKTPDGSVVTQAYWYQKADISDDIPYYER